MASFSLSDNLTQLDYKFQLAGIFLFPYIRTTQSYCKMFGIECKTLKGFKFGLPTSDRNERQDQIRRVGGNQMCESGGENMGSVAHRATTLVYKFQFLQYNNREKIDYYPILPFNIP